MIKYPLTDCNICYWPTLKQWTSNFTFCKNVNDLQCTHDAILNTIAMVDGHRKCLSSCQVHEHSCEISSNPTPGEDSFYAAIYMYMSYIEVEFRREHRLYDLNNIIAAVGGSMGLFLGFSFLSFFKNTIDFITVKKPLSYCKKTQK